MKKLIALFFLFLVPCAGAFGQQTTYGPQYGQCDPFNINWFQGFDQIAYPSVADLCSNPHQAKPINDCGQLGISFVVYTDAAIMDDGTVQVFSASQDLSQYSATADVQMDTTITMPDNSTLSSGGWSRHGYVMVHVPIPLDTSNSSGMVHVVSSHELNWPGCDGYGTIVQTEGFIRMASSNYANAGMENGQCLYLLSCPNGNSQSTCGSQVPAILVDPPPQNTCTPYLRDSRLVVDGRCFSIGKAFLVFNPTACN